MKKFKGKIVACALRRASCASRNIVEEPRVSSPWRLRLA
ncbi:hypothetical protein A2U01_0078678, partial [Trifolium medium]|nr:hypothetical protein [Trifolium medium]